LGTLEATAPGLYNDLRVVAIADVLKDSAEFWEVETPATTNPNASTAPVLTRTSGDTRFRGSNLWFGGAGSHIVQLAEIAPGDRKYLHRHNDAETVWVILEGAGEFYPDRETVVPIESGMICHAYPGEWHGLGNTGDVPLRYLLVEGPFWRVPAIEFAE
jgi:mannose-6-phosphate isomerase-like protein (cupin superfamily)